MGWGLVGGYLRRTHPPSHSSTHLPPHGPATRLATSPLRTVALTHNLVLRKALPTAFSTQQRQDPIYATRWLRCLKLFSPDAVAHLREVTPEAVGTAESGEYEPESDCDDQRRTTILNAVDGL